MSPAGSSSQHTFILVMDGGKAIQQAKQLGQQIAKAAQAGKVDTSALDETEKKVKTVTMTLRNLEGQPIKIKVKHEEAVAKIHAVANAMKKAQQAVQAAGGESVTGWMDASRVDKYAMSLDKAYGRTWGLRRAAYELESKATAALMAGTAVLAGGAMAGREYVQFADQMNYAARTMGLNSQMTEEFDSKLRTLAGTMVYMKPEEWAGGIYRYAAATGVSVESTTELNTVMKESADIWKLAKLGRIEYGRAVEIVTDIQSQFQLSTAETERIVAMLLQTADISKAEIDDLGQSFKFIGARAHAFGVEVEEVSAILEILAGAGLRGSMAGRGMTRLFENLLAPSKEAKKIMDEAFGHDAFIDIYGRFKGPAEAVEIMADKLRELPQAQRNWTIAMITTENAARALTPLINLQIVAAQNGINAIEEQMKLAAGAGDESTEIYVALRKAIYGYESATVSAIDALTQKWAQYMDSTNQSVDEFTSRWAAAVDTTGKAVMELVLGPMESISDFLGEATEYIDKHPEAVKSAMGIAGAVVVFAGLVKLFTKGITLYADYKMVASAIAQVKAADTMLAAAVVQAAAAEKMLGIKLLPEGTNVDKLLLAGGKGGPGLTPILFGLTKVLSVLAVAVATWGEGKRLEGQRDVFAGFTEEEKRILLYGPTGTAGQLGARQGKIGEGLLETRPGYEAGTFFLPGGTGPATAEEMRAAIDETEYGMERLNRSIDAGTARWQAYGEAWQEWAVETDVVIDGLILNFNDLGAVLQSVDPALANIARMTIGIEQAAANMADEWEATANEIGLVVRLTAGIGVRTTKEDVLRAAEDMAQQGSRMFDPLRGMLPEDQLDKLLGKYLDSIRWFLVDNQHLDKQLFDQKLADHIRGWEDIIDATASKLQELANLPLQMQEKGWRDILGMADVWGETQMRASWNQYETDLGAFLKRIEGMDARSRDIAVAIFNAEWDAKLGKVKDWYKDAERLRTSAQKQAEKDYKTWRSAIMGLFAPTEVTAEDMALSGIDAYEDKWDEYPRRIRAGQLDPKSRFKDMIPEFGTDEERNKWVQEEINAFYAGLRPEQVNWDALLDAYDRMVSEAAGKESMADMLMQKIVERGGEPDEDLIRKAFGITTPMESMLFGGKTPEQLGVDIGVAFSDVVGGISVTPESFLPVATQTADAFQSGLDSQLQDVSLVGKLETAWNKDITDNSGAILDIGIRIGGIMWGGMLVAMGGSNFVNKIATEVLSIINSELEE